MSSIVRKHVEGASDKRGFEDQHAIQVIGFDYAEVERNLGDPDPEPPESQRHARTMAIRRAALASLLGQTEKTFQQLADEIGCTRAAISKTHCELIERLGWPHKRRKPDHACAAYASNARRRWREWGTKSRH